MKSRAFTHPVRLAAILLLLVWVGPVTFVQTDLWQLLRWAGVPAVASAEPSVIPAGMAMQLELGTGLELHLRDGSVLEGRFLGRALLDSALYASRFAAQAVTSPYVPFALGDTVRVSLRDGRAWIAPFAGYGELALLLRIPDEPGHRRVPFESAREIRGPNGNPIEPGALIREFHAGSLPSAEALLLAERGPMGTTATGSAPRRVAVEDIEWVSVRLPPAAATGRDSGGEGLKVAGIVVLSVVLSVVLVFAIIGASIESGSNGCGHYPVPNVPLITRPFDRHRGCYVGDPLAAAGPWPGEAP